jgi:hypothetical protein
MEDEESYDDQPQFENDDEAMDDEMDDELHQVNGDATENGSAVAARESNLKSVKGYRNRAQGLF